VPKAAGKIANIDLLSHLLILMGSVLLLSPLDPSYAQGSHVPVELQADDLQATMAQYNDIDAKRLALKFKDRMPPPVTDPALRASVHQRLRKDLAGQSIEEGDLSRALGEVLKPVLSFYRRDDVYDIVVIDSPVPMILSDSGVVLLVSTGLLCRATSDDELLGYAAHEVGHEFLAVYSVHSQYLLDQARAGNEQVLGRHLTEMLAIIEIECDMFAAATLTSLGWNPVEFLKSIEVDQLEFPKYRLNHPPVAQRALAIKSISDKGALATKPHQSTAFSRLKRLLDHRN
jgi:hypothetical protein